MKTPRFGIKFKGKDLRIQVMFSVDQLAQLAIFENLFELNQTLLSKVNLFLKTCSTSVQILKIY
jgi:hypothetical protein